MSSLHLLIKLFEHLGLNLFNFIWMLLPILFCLLLALISLLGLVVQLDPLDGQQRIILLASFVCDANAAFLFQELQHSTLRFYKN